MAKNLVVVESPAKAKTINKYLGKDYVVKASIGHVRDLPKERLAVDIEHGFAPEYVVIRGKSKVMAELKKAAKGADKVYLAPDPDREGEAIAWHVAEELGVPEEKLYRVLFNEITERGIAEAMKTPGKIDYNKVDAQQARRVLDRLVGYQVSPLLWKKVRRGLSAGRVQSVALRLVCEREKEIKDFITQEYWSITAHLHASSPPPFTAKLAKESGKKLNIYSEGESGGILDYLRDKPFLVSKVDRKEKRQYPVPPFTTSKLQQEAARKLRFSAKRAMVVAQQLYEGVELGDEGAVGLITYMRTDSTRIAPEAVAEARGYIQAKYGKEYLPAKPPVYASQKKAQEAHEAIRPTLVTREPDTLVKYLDKDQLALYRLIWNRFIASQMNPAVLDMTSVDISAEKYTFRASGSVIKFSGFMAVYIEGKDEEKAEDTEEEAQEGLNLPQLRVGDLLKLEKLEPKQHFTQPPPRYTEASLVKELEEKGIGRPSTYATIMSTITEREYVEKKGAAFSPTELGLIVNGLLVESFPDIFDVAFTAKMEDELDEIEEGRIPWVQTVREFYDPFEKALITAQKGMRNVKREETPTDIPCDKCGKMMVIKWGRNGRFLACPGYPECKNTRELPEKEGEAGAAQAAPPAPEPSDEKCPKCGSPMVVKTGRFGRFLACTEYPKCKGTKPISLGVDCPKCGKGFLSEKRTKSGKPFFGCSDYPKCDYASWDRPVPRKCPDCGSPFLVEKYSKKEGPRVVCPNKDCGYKEEPASAEGAEKAAAGGE
ncbi:MAG TPA: type I DNA topoisomerase [Nitrospirota bacterium]|nr:type I DNA topoisomerase [Nitrospirota bacterium]